MKSFINEQILLRDWTVYHRIVTFLLLGMIALTSVHLIRSIKGGWYEVDASSVLRAAPADVWAYVTDTDKRSRWEANVLRVTTMKGATDSPFSTRLLTEGTPKTKSTSAFEVTESFITEQEIRFAIDAPGEKRKLSILLQSEGPCLTRVTMAEATREDRFDARMVSPLRRFSKTNRLEDSLKALERWMSLESPCSDQSAKAPTN